MIKQESSPAYISTVFEIDSKDDIITVNNIKLSEQLNTVDYKTNYFAYLTYSDTSNYIFDDDNFKWILCVLRIDVKQYKDTNEIIEEINKVYSINTINKLVSYEFDPRNITYRDIHGDNKLLNICYYCDNTQVVNNIYGMFLTSNYEYTNSNLTQYAIGEINNSTMLSFSYTFNNTTKISISHNTMEIYVGGDFLKYNLDDNTIQSTIAVLNNMVAKSIIIDNYYYDNTLLNDNSKQLLYLQLITETDIYKVYLNDIMKIEHIAQYTHMQDLSKLIFTCDFIKNNKDRFFRLITIKNNILELPYRHIPVTVINSDNTLNKLDGDTTNSNTSIIPSHITKDEFTMLLNENDLINDNYLSTFNTNRNSLTKLLTSHDIVVDIKNDTNNVSIVSSNTESIYVYKKHTIKYNNNGKTYKLFNLYPLVRYSKYENSLLSTQDKLLVYYSFGDNIDEYLNSISNYDNSRNNLLCEYSYSNTVDNTIEINKQVVTLKNKLFVFITGERLQYPFPNKNKHIIEYS